MNTKRQTSWLVSMLSLMVILSAYYLFTDNVDEMNTAAEIKESDPYTTINEVPLDEHSAGTEFSNSLVESLTEATLIEEIQELDMEMNQMATEIEQSEAAVSDKQVIEHIQAGAQNGEDYLASLMIKRDETLAKDTERLMGITSDPKKTDEEMVKAQEQLDHIEDMQYKISDLEDQLMQNFENAVIT